MKGCVSSVLLFIGVMAIVIGNQISSYVQESFENSITIVGTITSMNCNSTKVSQDCGINIEYSYQGKILNFSTYLLQDKHFYKVGDKIDLLFDSTDINSVEIKSPDSGNSNVGLGFNIVGSVFLVTGVSFLVISIIAGRRRKYLLENGKKVESDFQSVSSYWIRKAGYNYYVHSTWVDPSSNIIYKFKSGILKYNPEKYIGDRKIPVCFDPKNPKRYIVDISFLPSNLEALGDFLKGVKPGSGK